MKVMVLGAGVIGVSTAYELARSGHEVIVVDRQPSASLETSYANAGEISPGYSAPWAAPGVPLKAIRWLLMRHRPLVLRPRLDGHLLAWCLAVLRNCNAERYRINKGRMVRLAQYSRDCLGELRRQTGIRYDERTLGTLQLFRTPSQLDASAADVEVLRSEGVDYEVLDVAGCVAREPALAAVREKFVGGLRLPGDETGDCFMFTQALADRAARLGVEFHYGAAVERILTREASFEGVRTSVGPLRADACVVALGSYSPQLVRPLGLRLPVYLVKGYSITVPIRDSQGAPESTVMDESHKVAVTRLGQRIRAGGTAELAGFDLQLHAARQRTLAHVVQDLFPSGGELSQARFWCGLRPMTPDGTPILGPTPVRGLWLATGHGTLGWTMAAGTARVIADLISGRAPEIELEGLTLERYAPAPRLQRGRALRRWR